MGVLDGTTLNVDAILTKKGRELLSKGQQFFFITQFALADDEIDYTLWNENHPSGSSYYGYAIETMPILEAIPDETQVMRYKLVSLPKDAVRIPVINAGVTLITLLSSGDSKEITPSTVYSQTAGIALNATLGYTAILHNSDVARLEVVQSAARPPRPPTVASRPGGGWVDPIFEGDGNDGNDGNTKQNNDTQEQPIVGTTSIFLSDSDLARSVFVVGKRFRVTAKSITATTDTKLTIIGNESGGSVTISLTVNASPTTVRSST